MPKTEATKRVRSVAALLGLDAIQGRKAERLSVSLRMRVALARSLVRRPTVLLLDEPLANLEPSIQEELRSLLVTAQRGHGVTSLLATASREEALATGQRVVVLDAGRLTAVGPPAEFQPA